MTSRKPTERPARPAVAQLKRHGLPVTMESWLNLEFMGGTPPEGWEAELEIPWELQAEAEEYFADLDAQAFNRRKYQRSRGAHGGDS